MLFDKDITGDLCINTQEFRFIVGSMVARRAFGGIGFR
jgi:hypothetical protein